MFVNLSYIFFCMSNDHIELWMIDIESLNSIKQRHAICAYQRKQDQASQQSYYSILKILSTITRLSINTTSRFEERWRTHA